MPAHCVILFLLYSQIVKEYHHSHSLVDVKEPLNDIPEDNEDVATPSEDKVLDISESNIGNMPIPMIQVEITGDDDDSNVVPEIHVVSEDTVELSDTATPNEAGRFWLTIHSCDSAMQ